MLDIAEATVRIETEAEMINTIAQRCLGWVHGGGVRGNPNSGAPGRSWALLGAPGRSWALRLRSRLRQSVECRLL